MNLSNQRVRAHSPKIIAIINITLAIPLPFFYLHPPPDKPQNPNSRANARLICRHTTSEYIHFRYQFVAKIIYLYRPGKIEFRILSRFRAHTNSHEDCVLSRPPPKPNPTAIRKSISVPPGARLSCVVAARQAKGGRLYFYDGLFRLAQQIITRNFCPAHTYTERARQSS